MTRFKRWTTYPYHIVLPLSFFLIGLIYIYSVPHFESPDSTTHVAMIQWVTEHGGELPVQSKAHGQLYGQQASQPPLYYLLMMPVWSVFDTGDFDDYYQLNPHAIAGHPSRYGNRNLILYDQPYPPLLEGTSLAIYVIRVITLVMSTVTVYAVYQSARTIMPDRVGFAVLATAFTAFNPQFLFIGSSVSNDNLVTMLASLITWQMLVMLRDGFQTKRSVLLAILLTLATLSKLNGLVLVLAVALAGLWVAYRTRDVRGLVILGGAMAGIWLIFGSWWYIRNVMLYNELFGTNAMIANYGKRRVTLETLITVEWTGFRQSYWGLFGWFSIFTNMIHYAIMDILTALSLIGTGAYVYQSRKKPFALTAFSFMGIIAVVGMVMLVWWTSQTTGSQGRLIFPYIAAYSILIAMGLYSLRIPVLVIVVPMLIFCIYAPFAYLIPEYDQPATYETLPESATQTYALFGDIALVGYEVPIQRWTGGDEIPVTLYWQAQAQSDVDLTLFLSLIDMQGDSIVTLDSYPGWGSLRTTRWEPDTIYGDTYILQPLPETGGFGQVQLQVGWYEYPDGSDILPILENGQEALTYTTPAGVYVNEPTAQPITDEPIPDGMIFADTFKLNAYKFAHGRIVRLEWTLLRPMTGDWRVFAFVLPEAYQEGDAFESLVQKDSTPLVPLDYLEAGEIFRTTHDFELPDGVDGEFPVYIGWYNAETGERLPIDYPAQMYPITGLEFDHDAD